MDRELTMLSHSTTPRVHRRGAIVEPAVAAGGGERVVVDSRRAAVMMQDAIDSGLAVNPVIAAADVSRSDNRC